MSFLMVLCVTAWGSYTRLLEPPTAPLAESVPSFTRFNDLSFPLGHSRNPVGVDRRHFEVTQGSSPRADIPLATLGYSTESRWDSKLGRRCAHNYYHADGGGNVSCLISNGQVVASYRYDPFGNLVSKSGPLADANVYRFTSKEQYLKSGLYYYGYRFYSPNLQRWINRDPIGERGGMNLYGFVGNNPMRWADLWGLDYIPSESGVLFGLFPAPLGSHVYYFGETPKEQLVAQIGNVSSYFYNSVENLASGALNALAAIPEGLDWVSEELGLTQLLGMKPSEMAMALPFGVTCPRVPFRPLALARPAAGLPRFTKQFLNADYPRFKYPRWWKDELWERNMARDGRVFDVSGKNIDPGVNWEVGHRGMSFAERQQWAAENGLTYDQWWELEHNFANFRPELPSSNGSHIYETWVP